MYRVGQKTGPLCFTASNFGSIHHIGTKFGTNQRYFILTLPRNLLETTLENKFAKFGANAINSSKVTSRKTKWPRFFRPIM